MGRVIAVSDSHGMENRLFEVLHSVLSKKETDVVVFLGDGFREWEIVSQNLLRFFPRLRLYGVVGNNDWCATGPEQQTFTLEGVRFFLCHGHRQGVKTGLEALEIHAVANDAKVAIYGHTHRGQIDEAHHCLFVNPGTVNSWGSRAPVCAEILTHPDGSVSASLILSKDID